MQRLRYVLDEIYKDFSTASGTMKTLSPGYQIKHAWQNRKKKKNSIKSKQRKPRRK